MGATMDATMDRPTAAAARPAPALSLTLPRSVLRDALGKLLSVIPTTKISMPIAACVLIEIPAGEPGESGAPGPRAATVTLTGTDFDTMLTLAVQAEVTGAGRLAVPARRLSDFVSSLPAAAPITIAVDVRNRHATVRAGRAVFDCTTMDAGEFPTAPAIHASDATTLPAAVLLSALARAVTFASTEEVRAVLNTVCLDVTGGTLVAVGHAGPSLAHLYAGAIGAEVTAQYLIPRQAVPSLVRMFGDAPADATISLTADDHRARITGDAGTVELRLVGGQYPPFRRVMRQLIATHTIVCERSDLAAAVKRVAPASGDRRRIEFTLAPATGLLAGSGASELTVWGASDEAGVAEDVVLVHSHERHGAGDEGAAFQVAINATQCLLALEAIVEPRVRIAFGQGTNPMEVRGAEQDAADPSAVFVSPLHWSIGA